MGCKSNILFTKYNSSFRTKMLLAFFIDSNSVFSLPCGISVMYCYDRMEITVYIMTKMAL